MLSLYNAESHQSCNVAERTRCEVRGVYCDSFDAAEVRGYALNASIVDDTSRVNEASNKSLLRNYSSKANDKLSQGKG
jgi:hypothetical protein